MNGKPACAERRGRREAATDYYAGLHPSTSACTCRKPKRLKQHHDSEMNGRRTHTPLHDNSREHTYHLAVQLISLHFVEVRKLLEGSSCAHFSQPSVLSVCHNHRKMTNEWRQTNHDKRAQSRSGSTVCTQGHTPFRTMGAT